jgi:UDP-glucose:(heptosyl)LPS alpha-1,3-glucosyltransferase
MIKVAIITERADISLGGAERSVFELSEALQARGIDVHIIAAKGAERQENIHILCSDRPGRRTSFFTYEKELKKYLAENKFDIIHSVLPFDFADIYQPRGGSFPEAIARNAASYDNKFLETYKKITAFANLRRTILCIVEKRLCQKPDGPVIAALSNYVAEQFVKYYKLSPTRIMVIPNGVKTDNKIDVESIESLRLKLSTEFGLRKEEKPIIFLFAANNFRLKGLKMLLEAMFRTANSGKPIYLLVAGNGNKTRYNRLAKKFGIDKRIIFLGKVDNIQNYLAIADVAVLPTYYDPSSRFTLEAIAAAKPVITTVYNGASELITNKRHGLIIDQPNNIKALADAIVFLADKEQIKKYSDAIVNDKLIENISIKHAAEQLHRLYEKIIVPSGIPQRKKKRQL